MKLKNKLIPLMGVAASVATIAPISLTSCKLSKDYKTEDLTELYIPSIPALETNLHYNEWAANTLYFESIEENSEIFHEDICLGMHEQYAYPNYSSSSYIYSPLSIKFSHTNPEFGKVNIVYPGEGNFPYPTITFSTILELQYRETSINVEGNKKVSTVTKNVSVDYKNIPFYGVYDNTDDYCWKFGTRDAIKENDYIYQYNTSDYCLSYNYSEHIDSITTTTTGQVTKDSTDKTESDQVDTFKKIRQLCGNHVLDEITFEYSSNYLSNVDILPEVYIENDNIQSTLTRNTYSNVFAVQKNTDTNVYLEGFNFKINRNTCNLRNVVLTNKLVLKETTSTESDRTEIVIPAGNILAESNQECYVRDKWDNSTYLYRFIGQIATSKTTTGTYYFTMPKSFKVTITAIVNDVELTWDQTVYTNVSNIKLDVY